VITPKGKRADSWVGHHTFRHTCATQLFVNGWNTKQVQIFLGHHSPAFTLATYVHLLSDDLPELPAAWGNEGATQRAETGRTDGAIDAQKTASNLALARAV
jgi:integrase